MWECVHVHVSVCDYKSVVNVKDEDLQNCQQTISFQIR